MLVSEPLVRAFSNDPLLRLLAGLDGVKDSSPKELQTGIWEVGHYGSSAFLQGYYNQYPEDLGEHGPYGVCDGVPDILRAYPMLEADPGRAFVVTMKRVRRDLSNKGKGGGWRWHKWGEYIGTAAPTTEYLDDEPIIEQVYVYHIFERL